MTPAWWVVLTLLSPLTGQPQEIYFKRFDTYIDCKREADEVLSTPGFEGKATCFKGIRT